MNIETSTRKRKKTLGVMYFASEVLVRLRAALIKMDNEIVNALDVVFVPFYCASALTDIFQSPLLLI